MVRVLFVVSLLIAVVANTAHARVTRIAGDVYRYQHKFHYSVFVITDDGVVVTDPISSYAAKQLKSKIDEMTDRDITHLVYSHSHTDHASGGVGFGVVPNVIAHVNAPAEIDGVTITQRVDDSMTFELGSKTFELTYLGPGHSEDLIALVIRPENVGFIVDAAGVKQLPYRDMPDTRNVDDLIQQIRNVESLDFKIFAGGHGELGKKSDATQVREYIEELRAKVLAGLKAGKSVDDMVNTIVMDKYRGWGWSYENWRTLNIKRIARHLVETGAVE